MPNNDEEAKPDFSEDITKQSLSEDACQNCIYYPIGKLSAVTRKKNEIRHLLNNPDSDKNEVSKQYGIYGEKIDVLFQACDFEILKENISVEEMDKFKDWHNRIDLDSIKFRDEVKIWFQNVDRSSMPTGRTDCSASGHGSVRSSKSSLRVKLAEQRAKRIAEENYYREKCELSKEKLELEKRFNKLELKKAVDIEHNLERELDEMSNPGSQCFGESPDKGIDDQFNVESSPTPASQSHKGGDLSTILTKQNQLTMMLARGQERALLPRNEPQIFDGSDLTQYKSFLKAFKMTIETRCDSYSDQLYYLEKYTREGPRELVRSCLAMDPREGYSSALELLDKRYGNEFKIADSYMNRLYNWPVIKSEDGKSLEELSIFLTGCNNNMRNVTYLNQLHSPKEIMNVVRKLPFKMRDRWRSQAHSLVHSNGNVLFSDLVNFIDKQSSIINFPVFGDIKDSNDSSSKTVEKKRSFATVAAFSVASNESHKDVPGISKLCICCNKTNHSIEKCFFFNKKSHDEKLKFIRDKRLCFSCLREGHMSSGCSNRNVCEKCNRRHPTCLHNEAYFAKVDCEENNEDNHVETEPNDNVKTFSVQSKETHNSPVNGLKTIHALIPVKIRIKGQSEFVITYMALDNYSSDCFLNENLLSHLGVDGRKTNILLTTLENIKSSQPTKVVNDLEVYDLDENESKVIPVLYTRKTWPFSKEDVPRPSEIKKFEYLDDVPFRHVDAEIGLLVGANMPGLLKPLRVVDRGEDEPYATFHKLGWALNGPLTKASTQSPFCHHIKTHENTELEDKIKDYFKQDFDCDDLELGPSVEDSRWSDIMSSSIKLTPDWHYELPLPFKDAHPNFPSNRSQALSRLQSCKRRLSGNSDYLKDYKLFMDAMIDNDFAERVPYDETCRDGEIWYLVHHGVYHAQKNKLRVVFDCSLKYKGVSLNDMLLQGPDLTNNLLGVLLRFRKGAIAITGDIEKMFYQVRIPKDHFDYLRYFWFPNGDLTKEPEEYRLKVHVFGAKSSPSCSNYALKQTAKNCEERYSPEARMSVERDFYVDDLVKSVDSPSAAVSLLEDISVMVAGGGFNLTGFASNSREVICNIPEDKLAKNFVKHDIFNEKLQYERTLGVMWNIVADTLGFKIKLPNAPRTRRGVLSTTFSIYDPFGIAAPALLPGKRIFQRACAEKLEWDTSLPPELCSDWELWLKDIPELSHFELPRCYKPFENVNNVNLHVFSDGSEIAYGAVGYLRFVSADGNIHCSLVMAKSRLVPVGKSALATIPRIELAAACLAVQISVTLRRELDLKLGGIRFWSDSTTVLKYISNENKRFQRFVSNKITYIRLNSDPCNWRHVPTKLNPADLASRGASTNDFLRNSQWKNGPDFLWKVEKYWPTAWSLDNVDDCDPEVKKNATVAAVNIVEKNPTEILLESTSNWYKLKCRVAWMLRLKTGLRQKKWISTTLTVEELRIAELEIWKFVQTHAFPEVYALLNSKLSLPAKHALIKLHPFIDAEGLLRVGGRLSRAEASYDVKHPIILPKTGPVVYLMMRNVHKLVGHLAKSTMLSYIRQRYWIIGAGTIAKKIVHECIPCRKRHGRPSHQIMADLPEDRLKSGDKCFANVGIDCFGPFFVTRGRGKSNEKRYGVIFTCLSSRAVHIEVAQSLDTDSFLCALSRFTARRGLIKVVRSDNGTNFTSGHKELSEATARWNKESEDWMKQRNIEWKFQPPAASHFGGVWEREIRTIRKVLDALINEQPMRMSDERLNTLMCEVENILNNRPLTEISDDPNDLEPLTPNHILLMNSGVTFPPGLFSENDLYTRKRWKQVQYLADLFWSRWRKEYLPLLQERQKWTKNVEPHKIGDLVLIVDKLLPRNQWSTGRIVEVRPDKHGNVRSAKIIVAKIRNLNKLGDSFTNVVVERPIVKLILLRSFDKL